MTSTNKPLLEIKDLHTYFYTYEGVVKALNGVNLEIHQGDFIGLVGETGCGKSVTALSVLGLVESPGKIVSGEIWFKGENLLQKPEKDLRPIRGHEISMIFQDPRSSLNPVLTVQQQLTQLYEAKKQVSKKEAQDKIIEVLEIVALPDPASILNRYPHELSGGMCQRVMIAMALSHSPSLLMADEPTTALDVTIEAQILALLKALKRQVGISMLLITHNLGIVAETCPKIAVMYAGSIVEQGEAADIFDNTTHPYATLLLKSIPKIEEKRDKLPVIRGTVPNLVHPPSGCRFHPRCSHAMEKCSKEKPAEVLVEKNHKVSCFLYGGD